MGTDPGAVGRVRLGSNLGTVGGALVGRYLVRRALHSIFSLLGLVTLVFVLARLTGDPANLYLPIDATPETRAAFRHEHGFDQPLLVQLGEFAGDLMRRDFGYSLWHKRPALPTVLERLPSTVQLALLSTGLAIGLAVLLGCLAALKPLSLADRLTGFVSLLAACTPDFLLGLAFMYLFAVQLHWLPTSGRGAWVHAVLPVATLVVRPLGVLTQVVRTAMIEQLGAQYVVTARSKGLPTLRVIFKHAFRNALVPVLTVSGDVLARLLNGAVVVETVFGWPGIGKLTIDAIFERDFAVIQAAVFVVAVITFLVNFLVDLTYMAADPRIRSA